MDLKQFDSMLHDAEVKLKRLKALYEQWFQGIERIEPQIARKDLDRHFMLLKKERPRNTAARFRLSQLFASYVTYQTYWGRIARQIEEGTYERDVKRAQKRRGGAPTERAAQKTFEMDLDEEIDIDAEDLFGGDEITNLISAISVPTTRSEEPAVKKRGFSGFSPFAMGKTNRAAPAAGPGAQGPGAASTKAAAATGAGPSSSGPSNAGPSKADAAAPPVPARKEPVTATFGKPKASAAPNDPPRPGPPTPARPPAPPVRPPPPPPRPVAAPRPPPDDMRRLYDDYVSARRRNNESVDNLPFDKLASSIQQMKSKLKQKHGEKKIDFEVVVQNGRVGLKPKIED